MGMHDGRTMVTRDARESEAESRVESRLSTERVHFDPPCLELGRPGAAFVEAANGCRHVGVQALGERHHEAHGAARMQTEDDL